MEHHAQPEVGFVGIRPHLEALEGTLVSQIDGAILISTQYSLAVSNQVLVGNKGVQQESKQHQPWNHNRRWTYTQEDDGVQIKEGCYLDGNAGGVHCRVNHVEKDHVVQVGDLPLGPLVFLNQIAPDAKKDYKDYCGKETEKQDVQVFNYTEVFIKAARFEVGTLGLDVRALQFPGPRAEVNLGQIPFRLCLDSNSFEKLVHDLWRYDLEGGKVEHTLH